MTVRSRASRYVKDNLVGFLALFVALGGTGAYAANTIGSTDIIDGQVKSVDIGNEEIKSSDVKDQSLTTFDVSTFLGADVVDGTLTGADIASESIDGIDIIDGKIGGNDIDDRSVGGIDMQVGTVGATEIQEQGVGSSEVGDNSLTGTDINEATLAPTTAVGIAGGLATVDLPADGSFGKVASRVVPAGSYAILASAQVRSFFSFEDDNFTKGVCELRGPNGAVLGAAVENLYTTDDLDQWVSLSLNGTVLGVPAGGGEISLWCLVGSGDTDTRKAAGQMLILQFDGTRPF